MPVSVPCSLHPVDFLLALKTYEQGKKERGKMKWMPNIAVNEAITTAYYSSFKVGKNWKDYFMRYTVYIGDLDVIRKESWINK